MDASQIEHMRILVVEDDREVARFIERGLKEAGHTVDLANDGRDGLFLAMSEPYQAVVLDRMLPNVDGLAPATGRNERRLRGCAPKRLARRPTVTPAFKPNGPAPP